MVKTMLFVLVFFLFVIESNAIATCENQCVRIVMYTIYVQQAPVPYGWARISPDNWFQLERDCSQLAYKPSFIGEPDYRIVGGFQNVYAYYIEKWIADINQKGKWHLFSTFHSGYSGRACLEDFSNPPDVDAVIMVGDGYPPLPPIPTPKSKIEAMFGMSDSACAPPDTPNPDTGDPECSSVSAGDNQGGL